MSARDESASTRKPEDLSRETGSPPRHSAKSARRDPAESTARRTSRAALAAAFATIYLVWGGTYLANRYAIESIPPFLMASGRFGLASLALVGWLKYTGARWPTRRQLLDNLVIGLLLLPCGTGAVVWAQQHIPSGVTALIIGASPMFFTLVEWAWPGGIAPNGLTWIAILLGFAGVTWLAAPWESLSGGGLQVFPTLVILAGSLSWATGSIYSRHTRDRAPPLVGATIQMVAGGVVLLLFAGIHGEFSRFSISAVTLGSGIAFALLVIIGSLVAYPTFLWLTQHSTPTRVATYAYINPIVAVALGWLFKDEAVGPRTLVAAILILTAVAIITSQTARGKPGG